MKIYIENFNLNVLDEIEKIFKPHLVKSTALMRVYTDEGIYDIDNDNNKIFLLEPHDSKIEIIKGYFDNYNLIIDYSYFNKNIVNSIYGHKHISKKINSKYYKLASTSKIYLVIESQENIDTKELFHTDIYFECDENINLKDLFVKQEIIEFLSALN